MSTWQSTCMPPMSEGRRTERRDGRITRLRDAFLYRRSHPWHGSIDGFSLRSSLVSHYGRKRMCLSNYISHFFLNSRDSSTRPFRCYSHLSTPENFEVLISGKHGHF